MDPRTVEKLENKVEDALEELFTKLGKKRLPLLPSQHTFQMMAKAAVSVYEAAVESQAANER